MWVCAWLAVGAAAPTVLWRAVVGLGAPLGTPVSWRAAQHIPGSGTVYVLVLSLLELVAALSTLALAHPDGDRIPRWSPVARRSRVPVALVAGVALAGVVVLAFLCLAGALHWSSVDPFAGAPFTAWAALCRACYLVAPLWPVFLGITTCGYLRCRRTGGVHARDVTSA
ncbi:hypothetical protein [Sciscionella marina]|uniref:hypothetical protein n=1 Tax=Sciscionella marina TaxID=508770 RepID=UPI0012F694EA|nr:hypothetical protein [Sciscionella marina]